MPQPGCPIGSCAFDLGTPMSEFQQPYSPHTPIKWSVNQAHQHLVSCGLKKPYLACDLHYWTLNSFLAKDREPILTATTGRQSMDENRQIAGRCRVTDAIKLGIKRWRVEESCVTKQPEQAHKLINNPPASQFARCGTITDYVQQSRCGHLAEAAASTNRCLQPQARDTRSKYAGDRSDHAWIEDEPLSYSWRNLAFRNKIVP